MPKSTYELSHDIFFSDWIWNVTFKNTWQSQIVTFSKTAANLTFTFANMAKSAVLYAMAGCCILALSNNIVARSINRFGRLGHRANGGCFNPTREFLADGSTEHWVIHLSVFPQRTMQYKILHLRKNHTKKEHYPYKYLILWIRNKTTLLKHIIMGDFSEIGD